MDLPLDLVGGDVLPLAERKKPLSKLWEALGSPGELLSQVAESTWLWFPVAKAKLVSVPAELREDNQP